VILSQTLIRRTVSVLAASAIDFLAKEQFPIHIHVLDEALVVAVAFALVMMATLDQTAG
jgi:hypothetical protein